MPKATNTKVSNIRPEIADRSIPITDVRTHPHNYRHGDLPTIAASLTENGQYRPVIVQDSTGHVCAGNHTLLAAQQLGWTHIAADRLDLTDDQAARILAIDNAASDKARNDDQALAELLQELEGTDRGLAGTGYDTDDLDALFDRLDKAGQLPERTPVTAHDRAQPGAAEPAQLAELVEPQRPTGDPDHVQTRPGPETDHVDDVDPEPITQPNDVWLLGPHRLVAGDTTNRHDLLQADALCRGWQAMTGIQPLLASTDTPYDFEPDPRLAAR